jgi:photosynthetic reaction center cytochrome c subunit
MKGLIALGMCLCGVALANAQTASPQRPLLAEEAFKNVQVLKGISADEFMGTMGVFTAALGMSCEDCHDSDDSNWANYARDTSPKKLTARRMVLMMAAINKANFGGRQMITCYTCHRGVPRPKITPNIDTLYGAPPPDEPDDVFAQAPRAPTPDQVLDRYLQALGGAQALGTLTSFVGRGVSTGYGPEGERPIEVFAKSPGQRTTVLHTGNGDSTTTFDGTTGWIAAPLRPLPVLTLTRHDLEGVKLDAEMSFPSRIKQVLTGWRVGYPMTIDDRPVQQVQGTTSGGALATLYFDNETGLLVRVLRYADSPVGRFPTKIDIGDYREVSGVKLPFRWTVTWLGGQEAVQLSDVQVNVPIDAARFARPAPPAAR